MLPGIVQSKTRSCPFLERGKFFKICVGSTSYEYGGMATPSNSATLAKTRSTWVCMTRSAFLCYNERNKGLFLVSRALLLQMLSYLWVVNCVDKKLKNVIL